MADAEELNEPERTALEALRRDTVAPKALEASVIAALRARGLVVAGAASLRWKLIASLAACLALFSAGVFVGGRQAGPAAQAEPRYVLLLEGSDTVSSEEEGARVREYSAWARREASAGHLLSGEKLEPEARVLGGGAGSAPGGSAVRGFFVISAKDDAEALAIAADCPHLRHGGRVVLRKIAQLSASKS